MATDVGERLRPYGGEADLAKILAFVGECNLLAGACGYLHPGDVCHGMSNGLRGQDVEDYFFLHEEDGGRLTALVVLYPPHFSGYDLQVHPDRRGGELEAALLAWSADRMLALMRAAGVDSGYVGSDVMDCDTARRDLLLAQGYVPAGDPYFAYTVRSLLDPIPEVALPDGFTICPAEREEEAAALGEVHSGAFNSDWPGDAYLRVMRSPAYRLGRELVVVAPGGRFAAFLIYWLDPVGKHGLFEPVGCHRDFQRRGLTKALMYEGMRQMREQGMAAAVVKHQVDNPAAVALYASAGFRRKYAITDYRKTVEPR